jgi:hypothetical protein
MITCAEFFSLNDKNPMDMTRGERAAWIHHGINCPDCRDLVKALADAAKAKLSTENFLAIEKEMSVVVLQTMQKDAKDPEYMNTIRGK